MLRRRRFWIVAALAALVLGFAFRAPLSRALVAATLDIATGYQFAFNSLDLGVDHAVVEGLAVTRGRDPVLSARRVAIGFELRGLFPGGRERYGLERIELDEPTLSVVRHADGTFNLPSATGHAGARTATQAAGPSGNPIRLVAQIAGGRIAVIDPYRVFPGSRLIELTGIDASARVDSSASSRYQARGVMTTAGEPGRASPFTLAGRSEAQRGFAIYRLSVARAPVRDLVNYVINSRAAEVRAGTLRHVTLRAYALDLDSAQPQGLHLAGTAELEGGVMTLPGLRDPLRAMRGRLDVFDDGLAATRVDASLAGLPIKITGAIYNWSAPNFRLGAVATGTLGRARTLFNFAQHLPIAGALSARIGVLGAVGNPIVATRFAAQDARYDRYPMRDLRGLALYYDSAVVLAPADAFYGPVALDVHGTLDLGAAAASNLLVDAEAPPGTLPYVAQAVPGVPLHATALIYGSDLQVAARGVFDGAGRGDRIAGLFDVDRRGDGIIGPIVASRADGSSLAGAFFLNRGANQSGFWLDARDYDLAQLPGRPTLPGLPALAPPQLSGRLSARLAGEGHPSDFAVAGAVNGSNLQAGNVHIDRLDGALAGSPSNARLGAVSASGPWGDFNGRGAYVGGLLVLDGDYSGSFERLEPLTGDLGAHGALAGPVSLVVASDRVIVQTRGADSRGATVHGVPVDSLAGTLAVEGKRIDIMAATGDVAGGTLVAAGTLAPGERLGVSLSGVDARRLQRAGAPLTRGSVTAIGSVTELGGLPTFSGGVALEGGGVKAGRAGAIGLDGSAEVVANSAIVHLHETAVRVGPGYGVVDGDVSVGSVPSYRLNVRARDVPVGPFARLADPRRNDIDGTVNSDVAVAGAGRGLPTVNGSVALPEGTLAGQAFHDARAQIDVGTAGFVARRGTLVVGSTIVGFGAQLHGADAALRLDVPHANLEDFDDLFDTGDTLGGLGHIAGTFDKRGAIVNTGADVAIADFRYRRFALGDSTARWTSRRSRVDAHVAFGGDSGRLAADGTLTLAARAPLDKLLQRSSFDGTARLSTLDLGVWLPVLGYRVPVAGRVDATATIHGPLANPRLVTDASWTHGTIGKLPVDRAVVSFEADRRRATIHSAELALPSLTLTASGALGLGERDPLALSLHAKSENLGALVGKFVALRTALTGTGEADVKIDGTRAVPHVAGGVDIEAATVGGVAIPRALGQFDVRGRDVVVSGTELNFAKGALLLAGSVPFTVSPFAFGPPSAPITLDLTANAIDLTDFAPLLPRGSTLQGRLDGRIAIGGTAGGPRLVGGLNLASGVLQSPFETVPLTNLGARLTFDGNSVTLASLHAEAGGGSLDASGNALVPDLVHPGADASYALHAGAKALRLNSATFGSAQIDGTLALTHTPGALPALAGDLTLSDATIPFSALLLAEQLGGGGTAFPVAGAPTPPPGPAPPDAILALNVTAGNNVRVRSGNVDLGGRGTLAISGTVHAPVLAGQFGSTGGTLSYFNTVFRLQSGTVTFLPDQGLIPSLDAVATTHVINPDPNTIRNSTGTADITIDVTGPVNSLNIALSSDPSYDREQILGLLLSAPAIGADIFASQSPGQPFGVNQYGNRNAAGMTLGEEAFGVINAQFTRSLLSPIETAFGGALGLSNLAFNIDYTGGVGLSARKILGKNADVIYATSFTYPYRQTFGFDLKPNATTAAQFTIFESLGGYGFGSVTTPFNPTQPNNQRATAAQPSNGSVGFSLSLQRLYP